MDMYRRYRPVIVTVFGFFALTIGAQGVQAQGVKLGDECAKCDTESDPENPFNEQHRLGYTGICKQVEVALGEEEEWEDHIGASTFEYFPGACWEMHEGCFGEEAEEFCGAGGGGGSNELAFSESQLINPYYVAQRVGVGDVASVAALLVSYPEQLEWNGERRSLQVKACKGVIRGNVVLPEWMKHALETEYAEAMAVVSPSH